MAKVHDFFIKQISAAYPKVSGRHCRLSRVRLLKFPGHALNDLVLYQVEVQSSEDLSWSVLATRSKEDLNWFGFVRAPSDPDTPTLLRLCHNHFVQRTLSSKTAFRISEYLALYKRETIYPLTMTMKDGRQVSYWDTMLIRALELKDGADYVEQTYGSVKLRERWMKNTAQPEEPYRSGVLYSFPVRERSISSVQSSIQVLARHPEVFSKGKALSGSSLEIFHTMKPELAK